MAQSVFAANATQFIDGVDQDFAPAGIWNLGVEFLGQSKAFVRRCLAAFDLFGPAASGRPLAVSDTVTAAEVLLTCTSVLGASGWAASVERISRVDWDYLTADWTRYRVGSPWTAAGGDVATPPAAVAFTSPALAQEHIVSGMHAFVTDAVANRGGIVRIRVRADDEAPQQTKWCSFDANLTSSTRPRLRVTYTAADPAPIADAEPPALHGARPAAPEPYAPVFRPVHPTLPAGVDRPDSPASR